MALTKFFRPLERAVSAFPRSFRFLPFEVLADGRETAGGFVVEGRDVHGTAFGVGEGKTLDEAVEGLCWSILDALLAAAKKGEDYRCDLWTREALTNNPAYAQLYIIPFSSEVLFPVALRLARVRANLTQAALAVALDVTQQAIQKLETPGSNPKLGRVAELESALGQELVSLA